MTDGKIIKGAWNMDRRERFERRLETCGWKYRGVDPWNCPIYEKLPWRIITDDMGIFVFQNTGAIWSRRFGLCDQYVDTCITSLYPLIANPFRRTKTYRRLDLATGVLT